MASLKTRHLDLTIIDPAAYSYLLGMYLGDGHILKQPRTYRLRITLHTNEIPLHEYTMNALNCILPHNKTNIVKCGKTNCVNVVLYSNHLPTLFPQHAIGYKHERKIELLDWQKKILNPEKFVEGLIHSDGSRFIIKHDKYEYLRYSFVNVSEDISNLFKLYCTKLNLTPSFKSYPSWYTKNGQHVYTGNTIYMHTFTKRDDLNYLERNIRPKR